MEIFATPESDQREIILSSKSVILWVDKNVQALHNCDDVEVQCNLLMMDVPKAAYTNPQTSIARLSHIRNQNLAFLKECLEFESFVYFLLHISLLFLCLV